MDLNINRYQLAQQGPLNEAKTFEPDSNLMTFNTDTISGKEEPYRFYEHLETQISSGLYFVGLGSHVGFLLSQNNKLYFIHSNYIDGYVMTERIFNSSAFRSRIYYISDITHNDNLIRQWILNSKIQVNVE
ncbi:MAG: hypothetical protein U9N85_04940 [Bacteroidota bacterium]|nr:hypothetical protein [Bacteroidota bacterium]